MGERGEGDTADVNVVPSRMQVDADAWTSLPAEMKTLAADMTTLFDASE